MKHLRTLYKENKDWNRRQFGGTPRKSPRFYVLDVILGAGRSGVTCNKVLQAGMETANTSFKMRRIPSRAELNSLPIAIC